MTRASWYDVVIECTCSGVGASAGSLYDKGCPWQTDLSCDIVRKIKIILASCERQLYNVGHRRIVDTLLGRSCVVSESKDD